MKIGILTGGGDCGGINALVRAAVIRAESYGMEVLGIRRGWAGLLELDVVPLARTMVRDIVSEGGTILLTSRTNPLKKDGGPETVMRNVRRLGLDAVLVVGGEDTLGVAEKLAEKGLKYVGAPKTMDNDLSGMDFTFGFDSAVNVAMEAIDRLKTTGRSHERVMVVELFGRDAGWVAAYAGLATGADFILLPEERVDLDELCATLVRNRKSGQRSTLIVAAESAKLGRAGKALHVGNKLDEFGHVRLGGIGAFLAAEIRERTGLDTREVVLGHLIRGGPPSAFDRVLASRLGLAAVDLIKEKKWGTLPAIRGGRVVHVEVAKATKPRTVDEGTLAATKALTE